MVRHRTRTTSGSGGQPQPTSNNLAASDKTPNKSHHNPRHLKHPSKAHKAAAAGSKNLKNVFLTLMALTVVFSTVAFILFRRRFSNIWRKHLSKKWSCFCRYARESYIHAIGRAVCDRRVRHSPRGVLVLGIVSTRSLLRAQNEGENLRSALRPYVVYPEHGKKHLNFILSLS